MPFNYNGVLYRESVKQSPEVHIERDNARAVRKLIFPWDSQFLNIASVLGYTVLTVNGGLKYLTRNVPMQHPSFQGYLYAEAVRSEWDVPAGPGFDVNGAATGSEAEYTVRFGAPKYAVLTDAQVVAAQSSLGQAITYPDESNLLRMVVLDMRYAGKWQTLPAFQALKWNNAPVAPMTATAAVQLVEADIFITWYEIPLAAVPWTAIGAAFGMCNATRFGLAGSVIGVKDAGSLVFSGVQPTQYRMSNGNLAFDLKYSFRWYPYGANSFYRYNPAAGNASGFQPASRDGASAINPATGAVAGNVNNLLFKPYEMRNLFRPEP